MAYLHSSLTNNLNYKGIKTELYYEREGIQSKYFPSEVEPGFKFSVDNFTLNYIIYIFISIR